MKILVDLGHPAHIHYFRNAIFILQKENYKFLIIARDKEVLHKLLKNYGFEYINRGKGGSTIIGKLLYAIKADFVILRHAIRFKPDLFLSFASPYAAHISKLLHKPHITFEDTEHSKINHRLYEPFSDVILSPDCFYAPFSRKQLFFKSYMELCYLHPKYFSPDPSIINLYGLNIGDRYFILRFISWNAHHDIGQKGLSAETKMTLIKELSKSGKVFISSESPLPANLEKYRLNIRPEHLHHLLYFADLYIGEGSTTASECSVLGTPNILVNSLVVGYCKEQAEKYKTGYQFRSDSGVVEKALEIISDKTFHDQFILNHKIMLTEKINPTDLIVWFMSNYPLSRKILREDPDFQYNFR